jgi:DNA-binding SARP family transcriptional activator
LPEALRIRLFGSLELCLGDRRLSSFATRKSRALFSYLVLHCERPHPRELLLGTFWGDYPEAAARKHLRDTLWRIRQVLRIAGPGIQIEVPDNAVVLHLNGESWLDTKEFQAHLSKVGHRLPEEVSQEEAHLLQTAVALYRGDLLEEIYDEWCEYDRQRLRLLAVDAIHRLMMYHLHRREWGPALQYGQQLLATDPLHEQVHCTLMRCYASIGNRGAALRQYRTCARLLREELDVEPMRATVALYDDIRRGGLPPSFVAPEVSVPEQRSNTGPLGETLRRLRIVDRDLARTRRDLRQAANAVRMGPVQ